MLGEQNVVILLILLLEEHSSLSKFAAPILVFLSANNIDEDLISPVSTIAYFSEFV